MIVLLKEGYQVKLIEPNKVTWLPDVPKSKTKQNFECKLRLVTQMLSFVCMYVCERDRQPERTNI